MVRSILSAVVLANLLAITSSAVAEPKSVQASERPEAATQSASPAYSRASSADAGAAVKAVPGKDTTPFGFGWG